MKTNEILKGVVLSTVDNQIKDENPPETKQTFERLVKSGYSDEDAKKYIGQCVAIEIFNVMNHQQPFNEKRFIKNLMNLPNEPFE